MYIDIEDVMEQVCNLKIHAISAFLCETRQK